MPADDAHPVDEFWAKLQTCDSYPEHVAPVPEMLPGTAAFPASAGLCRPVHSSELPPFPYGGLMVVGERLDGVDAYDARRAGGISDGDLDQPRPSATWRGLYRLLEIGGVARADVFATNLTVGLTTTVAGRPFARSTAHPFTEWCSRFFEHQVRVMRPSVVMVLGTMAAAEISLHCDPPQRRTSRLPDPGHLRTDLFGLPTLLLTVKHPSLPGRIRADGLALEAAWASAD